MHAHILSLFSQGHVAMLNNEVRQGKCARMSVCLWWVGGVYVLEVNGNVLTDRCDCRLDLAIIN